MATLNLIQALNKGLHEEMERNGDVVLLGEDVGRRGGVFGTTEGLQAKFGRERVMDTPLSECGIVGTAIGMALYGLRPIAEIQFLDFIYPAFDQIVSELAKMRYRSGGQYTCPVVVRAPSGGGIAGGHYHSQSSEAYFAHTPGLQVVIPSTPHDAKGLLASAVRGEDPVIFLEPKILYRAVKGEVPDGDYTVPIGPSRIVREGKDVTVFSWGAMVRVCETAADEAAKEGIDCHIVDLRTLVPVDVAGIEEGAKRTGRVVVVQEAPRTCGYGAEVSALVSERAIEYLESPVVRVAGFDTPFPYTLEHVYMPDAHRVLRAIRKAAGF
ncbi:MAG: alpha-ketoacid dehydrogenase subunit beta [Planctomycetes bacterium]|nr:alpha-ketoacid dehydrogenase subunit beta [Planctomycetota bacterium]